MIQAMQKSVVVVPMRTPRARAAAIVVAVTTRTDIRVAAPGADREDRKRPRSEQDHQADMSNKRLAGRKTAAPPAASSAIPAAASARPHVTTTGPRGCWASDRRNTSTNTQYLTARK